jgi:hypothetical protein
LLGFNIAGQVGCHKLDRGGLFNDFIRHFGFFAVLLISNATKHKLVDSSTHI